jgi:hypothetical protein
MEARPAGDRLGPRRTAHAGPRGEFMRRYLAWPALEYVAVPPVIQLGEHMDNLLETMRSSNFQQERLPQNASEIEEQTLTR